MLKWESTSWPGADDEHARVDRDRRDRGPARVEDDDVRRALGRQPRALRRRSRRTPAGEPAARTAAADRRDAADGRDLEVVGGRVPAGARELDKVVDRRPLLDHLGLGRAAAAHRDHDHVVVAREQRARCPRRRSSPRACRPRSRRSRAARTPRRRAGRSGSRRRCTATRPRARARPSGSGRPARAPARRKVDDELRVAEVVQQRHAVVGVAAQLLGAADQDRAGPLVRQFLQRLPDDVGIVLAVDQRHGSHRCGITSRSIRPVYFSYSSVARSNWMIRSCP